MMLWLIVAVLAAAYAAAVAYRYLFHRGDWVTFQRRRYPLRPWTRPSAPAMVNPRSGWRSRNIPDPVVNQEQFDKVAESGKIREAGGWDHETFERWGVDPHPPKPFMDGGYLDTGRLAESSGLLVEMDKPIDLWHVVVDYLEAEGVPRREKKTDRPHIDFLWINRCTTRVTRKLRRAFRAVWRVKWFHGVERPNENAGRQLGPYGHPAHGADPAGHGTGAGAVAACARHEYDFADHPAQWRTVLNMAVHWATYRTTGAQVHRQSENVRGVVLGWTVARYPIHVPLTRIGSWQKGLDELAVWFPEWPGLLESGE